MAEWHSGVTSYNLVRSPTREDQNRSYTTTTEFTVDRFIPKLPVAHNKTHPPSAERPSRSRTPVRQFQVPLLRADQRVRQRSGSREPPPRPPNVPKVVAFGRTTPVYVPERPLSRPLPPQPLIRMQPKAVVPAVQPTVPRAFTLTRPSSLQRAPPPPPPPNVDLLKRLVDQLLKDNVEVARRFDRLQDENDRLRKEMSEMRFSVQRELNAMRDEMEEMRRRVEDSHYNPSLLFSHCTRSVNKKLQAIENRNKREKGSRKKSPLASFSPTPPFPRWTPRKIEPLSPRPRLTKTPEKREETSRLWNSRDFDSSSELVLSGFETPDLFSTEN